MFENDTPPVAVSSIVSMVSEAVLSSVSVEEGVQETRAIAAKIITIFFIVAKVAKIEGESMKQIIN